MPTDPSGLVTVRKCTFFFIARLRVLPRHHLCISNCSPVATQLQPRFYHLLPVGPLPSLLGLAEPPRCTCPWLPRSVSTLPKSSRPPAQRSVPGGNQPHSGPCSCAPAAALRPGLPPRFQTRGVLLTALHRLLLAYCVTRETRSGVGSPATRVGCGLVVLGRPLPPIPSSQAPARSYGTCPVRTHGSCRPPSGEEGAPDRTHTALSFPFRKKQNKQNILSTRSAADGYSLLLSCCPVGSP